MEAVIKDRGSGKTVELLAYMAEPGNEFVTYLAPTHQQAKYAERVFYGTYGKPKVPYQRFYAIAATQAPGFHALRVVIDEADTALSVLLKTDVDRIAFTERGN